MVNLSFLLCFSEGGNKYKINSPMKELPQHEDLNFDREDDIVYGVPGVSCKRISSRI